jgi:CO/xanthine dehydrogenase FAD-binding subunit
MEYHRPRSLDEALDLLKRSIPLAGGTRLTPGRRGLSSVVDLQEVGLDSFEVNGTGLTAGACLTLQSLVEHGDVIPPALTQVCLLEAGWNLRNAATLGGSLMAADGRSPLLTVLLALGTRVLLQPGSEDVGLDVFLGRRGTDLTGRLITSVSIPHPSWVTYDQVARSPADRPVVCAAAAESARGSSSIRLGVALGGFGTRPLLLSSADEDPGSEDAAERIGELASEGYARAGDAWASSDYRSEVAGILVRRVIREGAAS